MALSSSSSSSSRTWVYDVFPSFSGEDVRITFLSHFLKELDRKLIIAFKDNEIKRSRSLDPELKQAIKDSRIAVVVFSENYASSSWCLNELLEIMRCKDERGQMVIPVFYGLDPSHVRKQTGDFGKNFEETCHNKAEEVKIQWRRALTNVANILGYHSVMWGNEANMIEAIANDVLDKLLITPSKDSEDFVGIEDHIAKMSALLQLESEEVRMVGLWGSSGIGKTTIARVLFNRLSRHFQGRIFIDKAFLSESMKIYSRVNPDDYNMKLHLQKRFLSEILGKKDIKISHLGELAERLKHQKVLICIDDLDDQVVLDALVGQTQWFGKWSRIIVVTNDKRFLRGHGIDHVYEVCLSSEDLALKMFCRYAFKKSSPPNGFMGLAVEVVMRAGNLPLGLKVLGSYLRGRDKEDWMDTMPRLLNGLDGKIEKTIRVSYDGLNNKIDEAIFRHIACLFNGEKVNDIKLLLADSNLDVNIGLKNLVDKSLVHVREDTIEMHRLLQDMGKEIVRAQSDEPGEREFIVDSKDVCAVLKDNTGTEKVIGISLNIDEIEELNVHENSFKGMRNLRFLTIERKKFIPHWNAGGRLRLPKRFNYLPPNLKLLSWREYPLRYMPSNFSPENLVKLEISGSKLEKLWKGVVPLSCLKEMDLSDCHNLKEIPNLSMATNLEKLNLESCYRLVELPLSIRNLNKLTKLEMSRCYELETLPTGINLKSLDHLNLNHCIKLRTFPEISTNISVLYLERTSVKEFPSNMCLENLDEFVMGNKNGAQQWKGMQPLTPFMSMLSPNLTKLRLIRIPNLVELPSSSFQSLHKLKELVCVDCINLEILPTGTNLKSLNKLDLHGCSRLRTFPDISTNISKLNLSKTGIEEIPWWVEKFSSLCELTCEDCRNLGTLPTGINLKSLDRLVLSGCLRLRTFPDISTNISSLTLSKTGIEEVPLWIEKFFSLQYLDMQSCSKIEYINLNIYKLTHLKYVEFTNCGALAGADLSGCPSGVGVVADDTDTVPFDPLNEVYFDFRKCFKLDPESLLHQQAVPLKTMRFSGEQVPPYFTHRTTGTSSSLTGIPLPHTSLRQTSFKFRVCAVVTIDSMPEYGREYDMHLECRFKGIFRNVLDSSRPVHHRFKTDVFLCIWECWIHLDDNNPPPLNYVDMDLHIRSRSTSGLFSSSKSNEIFDTHELKIKEWGIRVLGDFPSPENQLGNPNTLPHVLREPDENNMVNKTDPSEEDGSSNDSYGGSNDSGCWYMGRQAVRLIRVKTVTIVKKAMRLITLKLQHRDKKTQ